MPSWFHRLLILSTLGLFTASLHGADNLLRDGSFEVGNGWHFFVPTESQNHLAKFEYVRGGGRGGSTAGRLSAEQSTRVALSNTRFLVFPGENYKVIFYYKAEPNGLIDHGRPGLFFRVNSLDANKVVMPPIFILADSKVVSDIKLIMTAPELATEWTKVEAIVQAPAGVSTFDINIFIWGYQGAILLDDVSLELMPKSNR